MVAGNLNWSWQIQMGNWSIRYNFDSTMLEDTLKKYNVWNYC